MIGKYKIITLCGSTKFKEEFLTEQKRLTLEGNIVISVGLFGHSGDAEAMLESTKEMLDDMHKRKIDMADEIFVINPGRYIGTSTKSEIEYAKKIGKPISYLVSVQEIILKCLTCEDEFKTFVVNEESNETRCCCKACEEKYIIKHILENTKSF